MMLGALLFPSALLLDRLWGEPPAWWHPVCLMGKLAGITESRLRFHDTTGKEKKALILYACGGIAVLLSILPFVCAAFFLPWSLGIFGSAIGEVCAWGMALVLVYLCLAPRSLAEHAISVALLLEKGELEKARQAVSLLVGSNTDSLDAPGVARACVESVGENVTDGVIATLFWAGVGLFVGGYPLAAALAVLHRAVNTLDAMWGKRNEYYRRFGMCAARLDDIMNFFPARFALLCIVLASYLVPGLKSAQALSVGWKFRHAHSSPNSAWSEAAFAGALGLKLGGTVHYGSFVVEHPFLGEGDMNASPRHIRDAVLLMWRASLTAAILLALLFLVV